MLHEQVYVNQKRPNTPPPHFGKSIITLYSSSEMANIFYNNIRDVWKIIASWGRWPDEDLGDFPELHDCISQLPEWLQSALSKDEENIIDNWVSELHDREWVWWSGFAEDRILKIDVDCESSPASLGALNYLISKTEVEKVLAKDWMTFEEASKTIL